MWYDHSIYHRHDRTIHTHHRHPRLDWSNCLVEHGGQQLVAICRAMRDAILPHLGQGSIPDARLRSTGAPEEMTTTFIHCTPNAERLIVDMARVSNPANQGNHETAPRLLRYLITHRHWSPFEMAGLCIKIETERDIAAQILRHRSFSFQEFSTRYATTSPAEIPALRRQDTTNRQNSTDDLDPKIREALEVDAGGVIAAAFLTYQTMLFQGVAKETARRILPLCTPTTLYMHGTLRSWLHYIEIRSGPETQLEHRLIAEGCRAIFAEQFPTIAEAAFNAS